MPGQIWNSGGSARWPSAMRRFASSIWPRSKTSISGFAPAAFARSAISRKWLGVFAKIVSPKFIVATSSVQIGGLIASMWRRRTAGVVSVVPSPAFLGSAGSGAKRPPDAVDDLLVQRELHRGLRGLRIAHMNVHHGRPGLRRVERGIGDLDRRDRHRRVLRRRVEGAGERAGDDGFPRHVLSSPNPFSRNPAARVTYSPY